MPKLTKTVVDDFCKALPAAAESYIWDSEVRGYGVRLMPTGVASYVLKYRTEEGRQRKLALARVGAVTPDQARTIAKKKQSEIADGRDPSAERRSIRNSITVSELCELYIEDARPRIKASTLAGDQSRIEAHVKPLLGKRTVKSLTSLDMERFQADIAAGKSARQKQNKRGGRTTGGKGAASRTFGMTRTILEFAIRRGVIEKNPAGKVKKLPEGKQTRFLELTEISALGQALRDLEAAGGNPVGIAALRFLLLTGLRREEGLGLPLDQVDWDRKCLRFTNTKGMRAGDVGTRIEVRAIGRPALDCLNSVVRFDGARWAFPASKGQGHFVGVPKLLSYACSRAALEGVTVHVLRHSFASVAAGLGYSELVIAGLIGHSVPGVTARYGHVPDPVLVQSAEAVCECISRALQGDVGNT